MVYCRHCGDQIPVDSVFCPSCGQSLLLDTSSADPVLEEAAAIHSTAPKSPGKKNWIERVKTSAVRRYLRSTLSVIRFDGVKRQTARWSISQVLLGGSFAFSLVGFLWSLFGHQNGVSWIGFGIVLGLGAVYTKEPPNHGDPPEISG